MHRPLVLAVLLALPAALAAQQPAPAAPPPPPPQPAYAADSAEIRQVVARLFDGMRARDTAAMRTLFHEPVAMRSVAVRQGQNVVEADGVEDWFKAISAAPAGLLLDERLGPAEIRVDGNLAMVWAYYEFYAGDKFSHCGVDSFQFGRTDAGWKIILLADSRRRAGCSMTLGK
jgi:hypothetical protein